MIAPARKSDLQPVPLLISAGEAAQMLGVSEATLRRMTAPAGSIPVVRIRSGATSKGGQARYVARYRPEDLKAWIQRELVQPAAEATKPPS